MMNRPEQVTLEILVVGGGGGGASRYYSSDRGYGGRGGEQAYSTISLKPTDPTSNTLAVFVGAGGGGGDSSYYDSNRYGRPGSASTVTGAYGINIRGSGGAGGHIYYDYGIRPGTVPTQGLFSDNTQAYGADAGYNFSSYYYNNSFEPNPANWGGAGSGGRALGQSGLSGIVIIRYPIYPTN
jgi:hypothetical protein